MTVDNLLSELQVDFQPDETEMFHREIEAAARDRGVLLGPEATEQDYGDAVQRIVSQLGDDVVELGPQLEVIPLKKSHFAELRLTPSPYLSDLFEQARFYLVNIPLTIVPRSGWNFVKLDSIVEFNPEQQDGPRPVAYQVLPPDAWKSLIQAGQSLKIGLNENLEFKVDSGHLTDLLPTLDAPIRAGVDVEAVGAASLLVGPFDYAVRRALIRTSGLKTPKVYWHMEGAETITQEKPQLAVVLQVPHGVTRVDVIGAVKASRKFSVLAAWLEEVADLVRSRTADYLRKGAPEPDGKEWHDITNGV